MREVQGSRRARGAALALLLAMVPAPAATPQDKPGPKGKESAPSADAIRQAITRGADCLLAGWADGHGYDEGEAVQLLALLYAGRDGDPKVRAAMRAMAATLPSQTYEVALQAMALARDDAGDWQQALARRAWWLLHAQGESGAWGYGSALDGRPRGPAVPTEFPRGTLTRSRFGPGEGKVTGEGKGEGKGEGDGNGRRKPDDDPLRTIVLERTTPYEALEYTDLSNTQVAVLGLHAAEQQHIRCPEETWTRVEQAVLKARVWGGGWGYYFRNDLVPTGSMTAGGCSTLAIVREVLDDAPAARAAAVRAGFRILERLGPLAEWRDGKGDHRGDPLCQYFFYWLWSLERAAILWDRPKLGSVDWYAEGARHLLATQRADGGWGMADGHPGRSIVGGPARERPICTAFAILFLARATPLRRTQITLAGRRLPGGVAPPADPPAPDQPEDGK